MIAKFAGAEVVYRACGLDNAAGTSLPQFHAVDHAPVHFYDGFGFQSCPRQHTPAFPRVDAANHCVQTFIGPLSQVPHPPVDVHM